MLNEYDFSKAEKINMNTTDKVQVGDSTTGTSTSTTYTVNSKPSTEYGWACPRCGRINAPWKSQCDCAGGGYWYPTWYPWDYKEPWWKQVYCDSDTFKVHPETTTWKAPSSTCKSDSVTSVKSDPNIVHTYVTGTNKNNIVGGSDYWDNEKKEWTNIPKGYSNSVTSEDSPWNQYSTLTSQLDKLKYEIEELKETK